MTPVQLAGLWAVCTASSIVAAVYRNFLGGPRYMHWCLRVYRRYPLRAKTYGPYRPSWVSRWTPKVAMFK